MTEAERRSALEAVAADVRICTRCRLHEGRTRAVPGEGHPSTEVVFVGEGPGANEDREGRPFVGRAGDLLVKLLATIGWRRDEVFITNVVKCRPPENRDPEPDEIAACLPYLQRQLEILDPALIVTLGRHSLGRFRPGARIGQTHGTSAPVDPASGARDALGYALYHPAAALRSTDVERQTFDDVAGIPGALLAARARRDEEGARIAAASAPSAPSAAAVAPSALAAAPSAALAPSVISAPRLAHAPKRSPEGVEHPERGVDAVAEGASAGSRSPASSANGAADIERAAASGSATDDRLDPRADETGQLFAF
ncbi:MAG: uracil-DNA glycosylase [Chloroflexi bacterium]|nr:uracil-DNA glycosylase [Chloroflexota bacterium]